MMKREVRWAILAAILLVSQVGAASAAAPCLPQHAQRVEISTHHSKPIETQTWKVKTAFTPKERERGLSGQDGLPVGEGVWFVMPEADWHAFWMKGMRFPIDLVWISPDLQVIGVETLSICKEGQHCPLHYPPGPVSFVLEIAAGTFVTGRTAAETASSNTIHPAAPRQTVRWSCTP
jgi:uncharacterized membrane protein (UPF0127 family)